ncbi:glutathione S-transferase family protein [Leisingera sp. JC11]|uniref:glutathione S-transferase family protein n=1 Tax=Leisingera sp. JC11 TaxID=3042469 RepID=UPI0034571228
MLTLYWEYLAGSIVVQAMLEELGAPYQLHYVDMASGEHRSPEFLRRNPTGRVPAMRLDGGQAIGETAAIAVLLAEMFPNNSLVPAAGDKDRAMFLFWLNVMATCGYMTAARVGHPERYAQSSDAVAQVGQFASADYDEFFDTMERAITGSPYFLSNGLTALDFYLTMLTEWHTDKKALFASRPALAKLCQAVNETTSYRTTMLTHALPST